MSKKVKGLIEKELKSRFEGVHELAVVSIRGIGGVDNNRLREDLVAKQIRLAVVKNSLAARAFEELGMSGMKELLDGPCALAYGGDSLVDVVKALVEWSKQLEPLEIKGGYLDGETLDGEATKALAKMPSRQELQGEVVMLAHAPGARLAGAVIGPAGRIAGCIKTLVEKLEGREAA